MTIHTESRTPSAPHGAFEPDELLALAQLDIEKGNISDALWKLKQITGGDSAPPGAFSICGQLYARLGLWERSQKMLQKHLALYPDAVLESFSLGLAHCNSGRIGEALKLWDELLRKQPAYVPALFYRALVRAQQGQAGPARQDLEALIARAAADNPYLKPAKEFLQSLESQPRPAAPAAFAPSAATPYKTG
jgi:tetratricopeptide (TPR) repeat protein